MKIFIFADMEGCSGISNGEFIGGGRQKFIDLGCKFMADDINACIAGCVEAGATEIIVRDGHSTGVNVNPEDIDSRADLIQGATPGVRFPDIDGSAGIILLGYHAMAGASNALLDHTFSSREIQNLYLNGKKVGEIGIDAAIAAEHNVPVLLVTGDEKACQEAVSSIPGVRACPVKKSYNTQGTRLLSLSRAHELIKEATVAAIKRYKRVKTVKIEYPATIRWEYVERVQIPVKEAYHQIDNRTVERTGDSVEAIFLR